MFKLSRCSLLLLFAALLAVCQLSYVVAEEDDPVPDWHPHHKHHASDAAEEDEGEDHHIVTHEDEDAEEAEEHEGSEHGEEEEEEPDEDHPDVAAHLDEAELEAEDAETMAHEEALDAAQEEAPEGEEGETEEDFHPNEELPEEEEPAEEEDGAHEEEEVAADEESEEPADEEEHHDEAEEPAEVEEAEEEEAAEERRRSLLEEDEEDNITEEEPALPEATPSWHPARSQHHKEGEGEEEEEDDAEAMQAIDAEEGTGEAAESETEAPEAATEETSEEAADEPAEETTEETTEEATEASEEIAEEASTDPAEEEATGEASKEATEETTDEPTEEATEEAATEEPAEEEATEEPAEEEATEEPAAEATEESTDEEATEAPAEEEATEAPSEEAAEEEAPEEIVEEEATEEPAGEAATEEPAEEEATEEPVEEDAEEETPEVITVVGEEEEEEASETEKRRLLEVPTSRRMGPGSRRLTQSTSIEELPESAAKDCPLDRFLTLGPRTYSGGFNNMLMTLETAILLARASNRTLIIPPSRNDRYNWLRFRQAIDMEALRPVWPCFIDSDQPWGEEPAPAAHRHLLGKGKIASHKGYAPSDFIPKAGTVGALPPKAGTLRTQPSIGLSIETLISDEYLGREEVRDYPVVRVAGQAWGGLMTMCPGHGGSALFWKYVRPEPRVAAEVEAFKAANNLGDDYVAVHLRWLEGKCVWRAENYYEKAVNKQVGAMCNNMWRHTQGILKAKGIPHAPKATRLFLASDRQRPEADKDFAKNGAISYDRGNKKDKYYGDGTHFVKGRGGVTVFEPAVDMFLLAGARLFIGNMLSTFSTNVAAVRYAQRGPELGDSVLAWPPPKTSKTFWECERAHFWCGPAGKTWSSVKHTKSRGTC